MNNKKIIPIAIVGAIICFFAFTLFGNKKEMNEKEEFAIEQQIFDVIPVKTYVVNNQSMSNELNQTGTFVAQQDLTLSAQSQGQIKTLHVAKSQFVAKGTLIATIDNSGLSSQLSTAQASLDNAKENADRMKNALKTGGVTQQQVENAELQVKNTQTALTQLQQQIGNYKIIAPTSGIINEVFAESGSYVSPGSPIVQLVDITKVLLNVSVNQTQISTIKMGQKVTVSTDVYPNIVFNGKIETVNVKADASQKIEVGVLVGNTKEHPLLEGMFGSADFISDKNVQEVSFLTIPRAAIIGSIQDAKVYVVKSDSTVMIKPITVGRTIDKNIEVVSGLNSGEEVVTAGQINLEEGKKIIVKN